MFKRFSLMLFVAALALLTGIATAQRDTTWMPIGGNYTTFPEFVAQALKVAGPKRVYLLMVPASFSYDATALTTDDLLQNTLDAEKRRRQLEEVCRGLVTDRPCEVALIPLYTRDAALSSTALQYLPDDLAGVYFLGGDQTIAMQILANTLLEDKLNDFFRKGIPMGGNSAGLAIESYTMIGGYGSEDLGPENGLIQGGVDLWNTEEKRGLKFGVKSAILEQHFWERSRLPRLLNALAQPGVPSVGIGVDSLTGGLFHNDTTFGEMFGLYGAAVLDTATYGAAATANYNNPNKTLSVRNVLFHTLTPGDFSYDTKTRQHSLAAPNPPAKRAYDGLSIPDGAGTLILGGNMFGPLLTPGDHALLRYFNEVAGGSESSMVIVAVGYRNKDLLEEAIGPYRDALVLTPQEIDATDPYTIPANIGGILVIADSQSRANPELLAPVVAAWKAGTPVMMDNAAAALAGAFYSAQPPTPYASNDEARIEEATQGSFIQGYTDVEPGLGMVNIMVEPRVMDDDRWGRVISLAYNHPELLTLAIADDTAVEITHEGAKVMGKNGVFVFDLRSATLDLGTNNGYVIANGILDVFGAEEALTPTPITVGS